MQPKYFKHCLKLDSVESDSSESELSSTTLRDSISKSFPDFERFKRAEVSVAADDGGVPDFGAVEEVEAVGDGASVSPELVPKVRATVAAEAPRYFKCDAVCAVGDLGVSGLSVFNTGADESSALAKERVN